MPLNAALIGIGDVATEHLKKLKWMAGVRVVAICDRAPGVAEAVAERFGVGAPFTSTERMLAETAPDVVHVLTPPHAHSELVLQALRAGAHVLVEKPIATSWPEYVELRDAARASERLLVENYNYRFMDVVLEALELLASGAIGEPVAVDVAMSTALAARSGRYTDRDLPHFAHALPGGALFNFASHQASVALAVLGAYERVCVWRGRRGPGPSDDELRALVAGNGVTAALTLTSWAKPTAFTLQVRGTGGSLDVDVNRRRLFMTTAEGGVAVLTGGLRRAGHHLTGAITLATRAATGRQDYMEGLGTLLERFYAAAAGNAPTPVTVAEMDEANRLLHALFDPAHQL